MDPPLDVRGLTMLNFFWKNDVRCREATNNYFRIRKRYRSNTDVAAKLSNKAHLTKNFSLPVFVSSGLKPLIFPIDFGMNNQSNDTNILSSEQRWTTLTLHFCWVACYFCLIYVRLFPKYDIIQICCR